MGAYYDEVEIEDMAWDEEKRVYHYPCPCGDRFEISRKQLKNYEDNGFGGLPVCIAKTHLSISGDASLKGAPTGHTLTVREARASVGAGFVYPICGDMRTMPGLGTQPAAAIIDFDENGEIVGLS